MTGDGIGGGETVAGGGRGIALPAFLLGFALSGFFDGVLLHQILQWHHLLSAIGGDLRFQIVADGWFHLAMYAVALVGIVGLARKRDRLSDAGSVLARYALIGFGMWHVVDALLSHWLLGIHRIRMDSDAPLLWDIGWLVLFGLAPIALGLRLNGGGRAGPTAAALVVLTVGAGGAGAFPVAERPFATAVFAAHVPEARARMLAGDAGARIVWASEADGVFVLEGLSARAALTLYRRGAVFVGGAGLPEGCFGWTRT